MELNTWLQTLAAVAVVGVPLIAIYAWIALWGVGGRWASGTVEGYYDGPDDHY